MPSCNIERYHLVKGSVLEPAPRINGVCGAAGGVQLRRASRIVLIGNGGLHRSGSAHPFSDDSLQLQYAQGKTLRRGAVGDRVWAFGGVGTQGIGQQYRRSARAG